MLTMKRSQKGAFLMGMLVVPIWLKRSNDDKEKDRTKREVAINNSYLAPATAIEKNEKSPRAIGYGLSFALRSPSDNTLPDVTYLTCDGDPKPSDKPDKEACNPGQGDTSCSVVLPVLCLKAESFTNPAPPNTNPVGAWTGGTLGATAPVMGAILQSQEIADARCEKELGTGYRMAGRYDGGDGFGLRGRPGQGVGMGGVTRYWVATKGNPGNCWDSTP